MTNIQWDELFGLSVPALELMIRGTAIYWFLFLIFRFVLRREIGSIGITDVLFVVVIADAAQNAMAGEYKSITDGFILIATIVAWNVLLDWLNFKFPAMRQVIEARLPLLRPPRLIQPHGGSAFRVCARKVTGLNAVGLASLAGLAPWSAHASH